MDVGVLVGIGGVDQHHGANERAGVLRSPRMWYLGHQLKREGRQVPAAPSPPIECTGQEVLQGVACLNLVFQLSWHLLTAVQRGYDSENEPRCSLKLLQLEGHLSDLVDRLISTSNPENSPHMATKNLSRGMDPPHGRHAGRN